MTDAKSSLPAVGVSNAPSAADGGVGSGGSGTVEPRSWTPLRLRCGELLLVVGANDKDRTSFVIDCLRRGDTRRGMLVCTNADRRILYENERFPMLFVHDRVDDTLEEQLVAITAYQQKKETDVYTNARVIASAAVKEKEREYRSLVHKGCEQHRWTLVWDVDAKDADQPSAQPCVQRVLKGERTYTKKQIVVCETLHECKTRHRDQIDWLVLSPPARGFALSSMGNIRRLVNNWLPSADFKNMMTELKVFVKNGWWLVVNRRTTTLDPSTFLYRYVPPPPSPSNLTSPVSSEMQYAHQVMFDPDKVAAAVKN